VVAAYAFGTLTRVMNGLDNGSDNKVRRHVDDVDAYHSQLHRRHMAHHCLKTGLLSPQMPVVSVPVLAVSAFAWFQGYKSLWVCSLAVSRRHPGDCDVPLALLPHACLLACLLAQLLACFPPSITKR
jgi:hypothetical protein